MTRFVAFLVAVVLLVLLTLSIWGGLSTVEPASQQAKYPVTGSNDKISGRITVTPPLIDLGILTDRESKSLSFAVKNGTDKGVEVGPIQGSCGCLTFKMDSFSLGPNLDKQVPFQFQVDSALGKFEKSIVVYCQVGLPQKKWTQKWVDLAWGKRKKTVFPGGRPPDPREVLRFGPVPGVGKCRTRGGETGNSFRRTPVYWVSIGARVAPQQSPILRPDNDDYTRFGFHVNALG
jgi:hypothetical protein